MGEGALGGGGNCVTTTGDRGSDTADAEISEAARTLIAVEMVIFGAVLLAVIVWTGLDYRNATILRDHGRRIEASVVRFYPDACGKRGCSLGVEYSFETRNSVGGLQTVHGHRFIAGSDYASDPDYQYALTRHSLPIVYNQEDINRSELNFRNRIYTVDPATVFVELNEIFGSIVIVVFAFISIITWFSMQAAKRKLVPQSFI